MEYLFSDCGFEVEKFIDIIPVAQIVKIEPGVVLLDHFLTTGYGADLCQELKSHPQTSDIAVILMSVYLKVEQLAMDHGADAYI
jgi:two-component system phosphate regulon response regulator PhoB